MFDEFLQQANELRKANEPFAWAIVVRREGPSSGKVGDKAIINQYGELLGWIGGGCTKSIVLKEAQEAILEGQPRLLRISSREENGSKNGVKDYKMTCPSGGAVDVYIEPVLSKPQLIIMGKSAIARALARLGKAMNFKVAAMAADAGISTFPSVDELHAKIDLRPLKITNHTFLVIATQGEQDEEALTAALQTDLPYIAFVASRKKRTAVLNYLKNKGIDEGSLKKIKSPAGLDIGAKLPEEVAVSILAEMIQVFRTSGFPLQKIGKEVASNFESGHYTNPVCGMPIEKATAKYVLEYKGEQVYFCCDGCKVKFEEKPEKYVK